MSAIAVVVPVVLLVVVMAAAAAVEFVRMLAVKLRVLAVGVRVRARAFCNPSPQLLLTTLASATGMSAAYQSWRVRQGNTIGNTFLCAYLLYMVGFHLLANLPLDQPLYFGVHVRFWMQV